MVATRTFLVALIITQCKNILIVSWLIVLFEPYECTERNAIKLEQRWKTKITNNEGDLKKKRKRKKTATKNAKSDLNSLTS